MDAATVRNQRFCTAAAAAAAAAAAPGVDARVDVILALCRTFGFVCRCTVTVYVGGRQPSAPLPDNNPDDTVQVGTFSLSGPATPLAHCPNAVDSNFVASYV